MTEASFASLNPSLLARKGGAKPAMRPQLGQIPASPITALEDLGWNDMGDEGGANVVPINSASNDEFASTGLAAKPPRLTESTGLAARQSKRAAFTLRLDPERHLKLRLAATLKGESAQQFVTDALDRLLAEIKDLDALAAKLIRK